MQDRSRTLAPWHDQGISAPNAAGLFANCLPRTGELAGSPARSVSYPGRLSGSKSDSAGPEVLEMNHGVLCGVAFQDTSIMEWQYSTRAGPQSLEHSILSAAFWPTRIVAGHCLGQSIGLWRTPPMSTSNLSLPCRRLDVPGRTIFNGRAGACA